MAIFASLLNVKGMRLLQDCNSSNAFPEDLPSVTLAVDQFHFVESIFEIVPTDDKDAARRLRVTLDHLANAAGLVSSPYFDAMGNYTLEVTLPAGLS